MTHQDSLPEKVDIDDSEAEHLTLTQPETGGNDRDRLVSLRMRSDDLLHHFGGPGHH